MPFQLSRKFSGTGDALARIAIQVEMKRRDMSYEDLLTGLNMMGANENIKNLRNKIARGTFSAGFFIMCILAMGGNSIEFKYDRKMLEEIGMK